MAKKVPKLNPNSILFLYEGETEEEFYKALISQFIGGRNIRINYANLHGIFNIESKVISKVRSYLLNKKSQGRNNIYVFIACDREGKRPTPPPITISRLTTIFAGEARINEFKTIIATQDLESWFYHDMNGIYKYLKVPKRKQSGNPCNNVESKNNRTLSQLFRQHGKLYQKGERVVGFLNHLDFNVIYNNAIALKNGIKKIKLLLK